MTAGTRDHDFAADACAKCLLILEAIVDTLQPPIRDPPAISKARRTEHRLRLCDAGYASGFASMPANRTACPNATFD